MRIVAPLSRNVMRLLTVCGSLQARSSNRALLSRVVGLAPPGVEVVPFDGMGELPLFNPDIEVEGRAPAAVLRWRDAVNGADALLVAVPEYGYSLPGALKNAVDWLIGSGELDRKVVATCASVAHASRGRGGLGAMGVPLRAVAARPVGEAPIVRGEGEADAIRALLAAVVAEVEVARADAARMAEGAP